MLHFWNVATNPWVLAGMSLHVSALVVWLWALSRVDISFAYPFIALGYVLVSLMAWQWLGENINPMRLLGMAIIIVGIIVLSRGG
jgi:multidrug transporter EmrE-like cation transporter